MSLPPFTCDLAVIGSGPAGTSAARIAAAAGLNVLILEKAPLPRYKTCGGGILARVLRLLSETSLPVTERLCYSADFVLSSDLHFSATRTEPIVYMTMRDSFDHWLARKAVDAGARLHCDCTVENLVTKKEEVLLSTTAGDVRARYVIAADGAGGHTAKMAGWPDHRRLIPALECEVHVTPKDFHRFSQSARFNFHPIPHGYAWVFPKRTHLSIGVLTLNSTGINLHTAFDRYLNFLGIFNPRSIQRHGYVIPIAPRDSTFARGRIFLTGDAAGFADPITAEGITNAILSGQLAGRAIASAFAHPDQACETYNHAIESFILPELRFARGLAKILYGSPQIRGHLFRWQGNRLTELMTDLVTGKTNYSRTLCDPWNYLKLFTKSSPAFFRQNLR